MSDDVCSHGHKLDSKVACVSCLEELGAFDRHHEMDALIAENERLRAFVAAYDELDQLAECDHYHHYAKALANKVRLARAAIDAKKVVED